MKTKLSRYKVINFRSVDESDWISVEDNSCLVGTNEAGKTNLLVALWKLRPANGEPIKPLEDFPRHLYSKFKADNHDEDVFIKADFELDTKTKSLIAKSLGCNEEQCNTALVQRRYNGKYIISLPYSILRDYKSELFNSRISEFAELLSKTEAFTKEDSELRLSVNDFIGRLPIEGSEVLNLEQIQEKVLEIKSFMEDNFGKKQNLPNFFQKNLLSHLEKIVAGFNGEPIKTTKEIRSLILNSIPKFVYYSDYGNLDSEIYLPRVIEDKNRTEELSESARAKSRTLDVLFRYVKLSAEEIYELGNDRKVIVQKVDSYDNVQSETEENLTDEEEKEWAEKKKERGVLLTSAASELTLSFKKWWQQGDYIFQFAADGNHFRINVSDGLRPEPIELEGRSRGLQWFFSFFLVFLVETQEQHANTILLLDEPGLSLHPLAQADLSKFFNKLAEENQIIYTSHSPFLVDMDNLANVKAVYVDSETGRTRVSGDLRNNQTDAERSIYPVHAALGLTVSNTLLLGCVPVLVEGPSDQIYLSLIKRYLIGKGAYSNMKELVFIPTGGVKGMGPVTKLVASRDGDLPQVLLDSDRVGKEYNKTLKKGRYKSSEASVLEVDNFLGDGGNEIEDLMPPEIIADFIDRRYRSRVYFGDVHDSSKPVVDQIQNWAAENSVELIDGWKVELARECLNRMDRVSDKVDDQLEEVWTKLFAQLLS